MQKRFFVIGFAWIALFYWSVFAQEQISVPHNFSKALEHMQYDRMGDEKGKKVGENNRPEHVACETHLFPGPTAAAR